MKYPYVCSRKGRFMYKDFPAQQNNTIFDYFPDFFTEKAFDTVIEIGTSEGGFSLYIYELSLEHGFSFCTYDIHNKLPKDPPFDFRQKSAWDGDGMNEIIEGIKTGNKTLLLVDGGDKIKEFNLYAPYLKDGDYIMTHDYATDRRFHEKYMRENIWEWCENIDEDLQYSENGLTKCPDFSGEFLAVAWSCFTRVGL
jgi:cephalosporin hydroxylase